MPQQWGFVLSLPAKIVAGYLNITECQTNKSKVSACIHSERALRVSSIIHVFVRLRLSEHLRQSLQLHRDLRHPCSTKVRPPRERRGRARERDFRKVVNGRHNTLTITATSAPFLYQRIATFDVAHSCFLFSTSPETRIHMSSCQ